MYDLSNKKLNRMCTLISKKEKAHALSKAKTLEETLLSKKNTLEGVKNAQLYLEHSHQLFYKCVKYTF